MSKATVVYVVDDDHAVRDSIRTLLESAGYVVRDYERATILLADGFPSGSCVIADVRMPEMDGLELQVEIARRNLVASVIVITGHGDVPLAVRAMKAGAIDFIEKPFDDELLLASVRKAVEIGDKARDRLDEATDAMRLLELLTPREHGVLDQLVAGKSNKVAAFDLGISPRTVEIHRAHIMDKLAARSLSDLVRIAIAASGAAPSKGKN